VSLFPSTARPFDATEFVLTLRYRHPTRGHRFARVSYTVSTLLLAHFGDFKTPSYRGATQILFIASNSKVYIAVEWPFRDLKMYLTHVDFPRKLRMGIIQGGLWDICSITVRNFRAFAYGIQAAENFDCYSMSIEEFLEKIFIDAM
jgi:hypothetical protein